MDQNNPNDKEQPERIRLNFVMKEVGDSPEFILDLLKTFDSTLDAFDSTLRLMRESKDVSLLSNVAHKFKPSLKMFDLQITLEYVHFIESEIYHKAAMDDLLGFSSVLSEKIHHIKHGLDELILEFEERVAE